METRQLEYFIALASIGSFSKAADELHITQGALSKSIRALEDDFGSQLVDRSARRVELTPMGEFVLDRAKRLVQDADNLLRSAEVCRSNVAGTLRLGLGASPGTTMSAPLIRHLLKSFPDLKLKLRRGSADQLIKGLRDRSIDLLIIDGRQLAPAEDLVVETIGSFSAGAVCRSEHPLANQTCVTFEQVVQYPIFASSVSDEVARMMVSRYGTIADLRSVTAVDCEELETLIAAATLTDAVYLGVLGAAADQIRRGTMVKLGLMPPMEISVPIVLARLAGRTAPLALAAVRSVTEALVAELSC